MVLRFGSEDSMVTAAAYSFTYGLKPKTQYGYTEVYCNIFRMDGRTGYRLEADLRSAFRVISTMRSLSFTTDVMENAKDGSEILDMSGMETH